RCDRRFRKIGVHVERIWLDIHKYWPCTGIENRICRGNKREWGRDHLIAITDTMSQQRHVECRGPIAGSNGMVDANVMRECLLKISDHATLRELPTLKYGDNGINFFLANKRFCYRDHATFLHET